MGGGHGGLGSLGLAAFSLGRALGGSAGSRRAAGSSRRSRARAIGMAVQRGVRARACARAPRASAGAAVSAGRRGRGIVGAVRRPRVAERGTRSARAMRDVRRLTAEGSAAPPPPATAAGRLDAIREARAMLGILMAPALVGVSTLLDARVGPIVIDTHTAPGVFGR